MPSSRFELPYRTRSSFFAWILAEICICVGICGAFPLPPRSWRRWRELTHCLARFRPAGEATLRCAWNIAFAARGACLSPSAVVHLVISRPRALSCPAQSRYASISPPRPAVSSSLVFTLCHRSLDCPANGKSASNL